MSKSPVASNAVPELLVPAETVTIDAPLHYGSTNVSSAEDPPPEAAPPPVLQQSQSDGALTIPVYRDSAFSILFYGHLAVMLFLSMLFGHYATTTLRPKTIVTILHDDRLDDQALKQFEELNNTVESYVKVYLPRLLEYVVLPCAMVAFCFSLMLSAFLIPLDAQVFVRCTIIVPMMFTIFLVVMVCINAYPFYLYVSLLVLLALTAPCLVAKSTHFVSFAATNLRVAVESINANWGVYALALGFSILGFVWNLFWIYVTVGVMTYENKMFYERHPNLVHRNDILNSASDPVQVFTVIFLLISLCWTGSVILNTVQVTVAGVVATWCYDRMEARSFCSPAVTGSLLRSVKFSFGAICLGSLFEGPVSTLRKMVRWSRRESESGCCCCCCVAKLCCCLPVCIASALEDVLDYFNQWAYVFVGVYGDGYLESGRNVMELFVVRGWTEVIENDVVNYSLNFATFIIGLLSGLVAILWDNFFSYIHSNTFLLGHLPGRDFCLFGIGFVVGVSVSSVMINVIKGAVNTLIVCFADSPGRLRENHPEATESMVETWRESFPESRIESRLDYDPVV